MSKLKKSQKSLIAVHSLRIILELFTSTFLISNILAQNPDTILGQGLISIGLFYMSWFAIFSILDFVSSYFVDRNNRSLLLRIGIIFNMFLIIALVFWGKTIANWIILAGVICGISDAFYYSSYLVMRNELSCKGSFKNFNITNTILTNLVKIVVPVLMGYIIDIATYSTIAIYIVIIAAAQFVLSFLIEPSKPENSSFELKKFLKYLKTNKEDFSKIKYTYINALLAGFKTSFSTIVVILTIYIFKTNLSLGLFTSIFSLITMLLLMLYKKIDDHPKVNKFAIYLLIGILPVVSCIVMVCYTTTITLVITNFTLTIVNYFSDYFGTVERDVIIKNLNKYEFIAEHQYLVEFTQSLSRILVFALFAIVGLINNFTVFKILLIAIIIITPFKFIVMYKQRSIRKEFELQNQK